MKFGTKVIHAGIEPDPTTGAIMTPIYQTSTYVQRSPGDHQGFEYSRTQNPTRDTLQDNLAALENGKHGLCFASGMAAIDAVIKTLKSGDQVIASNDLYGGSGRLFNKIFTNFGLSFKYTSMEDTSLVEELISENTKLIWIETPSNPMMNIIDIKEIANIAKKNNILLGVDNTYATPYLQTPLDLGADIVMHSVTKFLGGHSDVIMGALVVNDAKLAENLAFIQNSSGAVSGPMDSFLVLRGIKTLHLRMEKHCENCRIVAEYLKNHTKVETVYWPGFESHPNHHVAKEQMKDFGGMVSFLVKSGSKEEAIRICERLKIFSLAESLGGVESLVNHPAIMTHASVSFEQRQKIGILDSLIRLSVGIEDIDDILADLTQALGPGSGPAGAESIRPHASCDRCE